MSPPSAPSSFRAFTPVKCVPGYDYCFPGFLFQPLLPPPCEYLLPAACSFIVSWTINRPMAFPPSPFRFPLPPRFMDIFDGPLGLATISKITLPFLKDLVISLCVPLTSETASLHFFIPPTPASFYTIELFDPTLVAELFLPHISPIIFFFHLYSCTDLAPQDSPLLFL